MQLLIVNAGSSSLKLRVLDAGDETVSTGHECLSVGRVAWEHIQSVLAEHGGNVAATARALGMHRRTLQRKLFKFPARR